MKPLIDIVNFNADASCLSSEVWLDSLAGGRQSRLCRWLGLYVQSNRRVCLGFVGGALADVARLNPEALALVRDHAGIFEAVLRPFAHDVALLRTPGGFRENFKHGRCCAARELPGFVNYFLPAEFMLTSEQVKILQDEGVEGVFINSGRFRAESQARVPTVPYVVQGVLGARLRCVPVCGELTGLYLDALHEWGGAGWSHGILGREETVVFSWRDGESALLIPDGVEREAAWLAAEDPAIVRRSLRETLAAHAFQEADTQGRHWTYPVHSFSAWLKEFRMLGFLERVRALEEQLADLPIEVRVAWLQAIGSDVLSAVEKESPLVQLRRTPGSPLEGHVIERSERGFEGEEFLALAELLLASPEQGHAFLRGALSAHMQKFKARLDYLQALAGTRQ